MPDLPKTEPDKTGISLIRINNEKEMRAWNVDELSQQLWGNDVPREYPVYVVFYHGHPCGFFLTVQQMVVYPALHPDSMPTRAFIRIVRSLVTEFKRMTGNPLFMLCDKSEDVSPEQMQLMRLKKTKETAYEYDGE